MKEKRLLLSITLFLSITTCLVIQSATIVHSEVSSAVQSKSEFADNRLIVKLKPEVDRGIVLGKVRGQVVTGLAPLDSLNLKFKVSRQEKLLGGFMSALQRQENLSGIYILEVPAGTDVERMRLEYESRPEVEYAEPDYRLDLHDTPNDPLFPHQWYLNNLGAAQNGGQGYYGNDRQQGHQQVMKFGTEDADIDALEAFERNDDVTIPLVGIIDTGVDIDHEDLTDHIWNNPGEIPSNGIDDDHNGFVDDFYGWDFSGDVLPIQEDSDPRDTDGHGTHCAGIVAAVRSNGIGISGIVTPCRIIAIKIFPNAHTSLGAKGIVYAAEMGCDVINMSWGGSYPSKLLKDALDYAIYKGVLPVASAGNDSTERLNYPAAFNGVLTVGASNSGDLVTAFSTLGDHINLVAPGEDILSLKAEGTDMYAENGFPQEHIVDEKYYLADGTSMAAPCAAGVAAYILAVSPGISAQRVIQIMEQSADDIVYPFGGDSLYSPGKDIYTGYGRANLNSALQLVSSRIAKIDYPTENALVSGEVAVMGTAGGPNFESYLLEYGEGFSPGEWIEIKNSVTPVMNDTLGLWNSSSLSGLFTLRLTVGDQNQAKVRVIANNENYVKIISPEEGEIVEGVVEIQGYAVAREFSHYTLEYVREESPMNWIPITTSTKMVADGSLGNWLVSLLDVSDYSIRLSVHTTSGGIYSDTVVITVKSIASSGWEQELTSNGSLSPAIGDIDGDGYDEIIVGVGGSWGVKSMGGIEVFSHDGQRELGWPRDTERNMMCSPALGDLDGDGVQDIVICSDFGIHAYLSTSPSWSAAASTKGSEFWGLATPIIADLEEDGNPEVLTMDVTGKVYAWRGDGQSVIPGTEGRFAQTAGSASDMNFPCLAVADLDGDGQNEVIAGAAHPTSGEFGNYQGVGGIYIWDIDGTPLLDPAFYPFKLVHVFGLAVANVDESDDLEILAFAADGNRHVLCALKKDGSQSTGYPIVLEDVITGWWFGNHPSVGDLDGDGSLEIVTSLWTIGEARLYAWHQNGIPLVPGGPLVSLKSSMVKEKEAFSALGNSIGEITARCKNMSRAELISFGVGFEDQPFLSEVETFGSPILADIDADNSADIIVRAGHFLTSGYERLCAWDFEGNPLPGFPLYASAESSPVIYFPYTPLVADVDKDGKTNLILCTEYSIHTQPKVVSWEFDIDYNYDLQPWPKYMHDSWNSGREGFNPPTAEGANFPPAGFCVKAWSNTSVTLGWVPKAPWAAVGYNIYRATNSGDPGEKVNAALIPQPDSQYQDVGLIPGETYYYNITSVDHDLIEGIRSPEIGITPGGPTTPAQPLAQIEGNVVTLIWQANPQEEEVQEYLIYHKPLDHDKYYLLSSVSETTFVDASVKEAGDHFYRVSAFNSIGLESYPSTTVSVQIEPVGTPPGNLKVLNWLGEDVTFGWRVKQGGEGCYVYRSEIPGVYHDPPLNSEPIDDPFGPDITFQDLGLSEGVNYHYVVTQIQGGIETSPSNRADFLAGRPHAITKVSGEIKDCHIVVHWNPSSEGDVTRYKIYDGIGHGGDIALTDSVEYDTIYVDPATDDSLKHYFWITTVDSLGLESFLPFYLDASPAFVKGPLFPPTPPSEFRMAGETDTSITFKFFGASALAYNIYYGTKSGEYEKTPVNPVPVPNVSPREFTYRTTNLHEGQKHFFNCTCLKENECGTSESWLDVSNEINFVYGRPRPVAGLVAKLDDKCNGVLFSWKPGVEGDLAKYNIYRSECPPPWYRCGNYHFLDSVFVPDTIYLDTNMSIPVGLFYTVTAVDTFDQESYLGQKVGFYIGIPDPPVSLEIVDISNTAITLNWNSYLVYGNEYVIGCNVYRSPKSGYYQGRKPINDTLISYVLDDEIGWASYTDSTAQEGLTYYYTVTNVDICGWESDPYLCSDPWCSPLEDTALAGMPHKPQLVARSSADAVTLRMSSLDSDINGYRIFRKKRDQEWKMIKELCRDTIYVDSLASVGADYLYRATAVDFLDLESYPSYEVEGCLMPLDLGMLLVDMTRGSDFNDGVNGDSVNAFYQRALSEYDYAFIDRSDQQSPLRLFDLSRYSVAVIHSEDQMFPLFGVYPVLAQYLNAGGALLIEGRDLFCPLFPIIEQLDFMPGNFEHDFLNIDSAYLSDLSNISTRSRDFIGAERTSQMTNYPQKVELDTFRINNYYGTSLHEAETGIPGVGYFVPLDSSEVIYSFKSFYDTSSFNGKPVALKHFTKSSAVIYLGFPLWFVREEIATKILDQALSELLEFANRPTPFFGYSDDLANASVYPNPFKPFQGHSHVTFDGLTHHAKIEIFTIVGEKVRTLEEIDGDGEVSWNVTNEQGNKLSSGIYIYRITNDQGQGKVSKLAVIR